MTTFAPDTHPDLADLGPPPVAGSRARARRIERRANRLARALLQVGVGTGAVVALATCAEEDHATALAAASLLGLSTIEAACHIDAEAFTERCADADVSVVLACEHGTDVWRASRCGGLIFGEGLGVPWWRLAEAQQSAEALAPATR